VPLRAGHVVAFKTATTFVDHLWELLAPLLSGADMLLLPDDPQAAGGTSSSSSRGSSGASHANMLLQPGALVQLLVDGGVTHLVRGQQEGWVGLCVRLSACADMHDPAFLGARCEPLCCCCCHTPVRRQPCRRCCSCGCRSCSGTRAPCSCCSWSAVARPSAPAWQPRCWRRCHPCAPC
jgi:hypothetical protein